MSKIQKMERSIAIGVNDLIAEKFALFYAGNPKKLDELLLSGDVMHNALALLFTKGEQYKKHVAFIAKNSKYALGYWVYLATGYCSYQNNSIIKEIILKYGQYGYYESIVAWTDGDEEITY